MAQIALDIDDLASPPPRYHAHLTTLTLRVEGYNNYFVDCWHLPHLRHLTLQGLTDAHVTTAFSLRLLDKYGKQLVSLSLDAGVRGRNRRLPDMRFVERCPNLTEVIFGSGVYDSGQRSLDLYPSMECVGVHVAFSQRVGIIEEGLRPRESMIRRYGLARFPNLKYVRVVNARFSPEDEGDFWSALANEGDIVWQDALGVVIPRSRV